MQPLKKVYNMVQMNWLLLVVEIISLNKPQRKLIGQRKDLFLDEDTDIRFIATSSSLLLVLFIDGTVSEFVFYVYRNYLARIPVPDMML